ncbi:conserved hypothetical protein [Pseudomonas sp. 8Z]|uniref:hypothetical protein n=1 Tax=Pseudomonas sp. 8Z TaxID=2653166 RepID=UPI0012EFB405|nr:hypothetical protein [Pseudomonas sp. 8Z]VXC71068.1 conserved hypothetical protein [Pseudomonas sp. 8Z]
MFTPVIQEEISGCAIAAVANILSKSYAEMKAIANGLGIYAEDPALWSDTRHVRRLLANAAIPCSAEQTPFTDWQALPDLALLAIKHHREGDRDFWHWVVFRRSGDYACVLDSASYLPNNLRTDFAEMQPKWFIEVQG